MRLLITQHNIGKFAAHYLCRKIQQFRPTVAKPFILGLPTGSTPLHMYQELIKLHRAGIVSFANVITFNMDEYVGLAKDHPQSYHYYMQHNFFRHIDIKPEHIHILDGNGADLEAECERFERQIRELGGLNIIFGGVGEDGHIAFNEPGSSPNSVTRVKTLNYSTVCANSRFFEHDIANTPHLALTMGIKTIMDAGEVIILAQGVNKSHAVCHAIEGAVSSMCPVTALQLHNKVVLVCDELAAYELKLKTVRYFAQIQDEYSQVLATMQDLI